MLNDNFPTLWCPPEVRQMRHQDQGSTTPSSTVSVTVCPLHRHCRVCSVIKLNIATTKHSESSSITASSTGASTSLGSTRSVPSWRYKPLMTDFFPAFTQRLGVKLETLSSFFSTFCTVYIQTVLNDKKQWPGVQELTCVFFWPTNQPYKRRAPTYLPSVKQVEHHSL